MKESLFNEELNSVSKKRFLVNDQIIFSRFSGDKNPIHIDKIAARRTLYGQRIVHGMHALLWALDSLARVKQITGSKIKVQFLKPIFLNEEVYCIWSKKNKQLSILSHEITLAQIDIEVSPIDSNNQKIRATKAALNYPNELSIQECSKLVEQPFMICGDTRLANKLFPSFVSHYGKALACELAAISYLVGMQCPGLHSMFVSLAFEVMQQKNIPVFRVIKTDQRFNLVNILVNGNALLANIESFFRPQPSQNLHISKYSSIVKNDQFKNIRALVVGGSRGLGEATAKLIAAGGGHAIITYHVGEEEASKIANEIIDWGGSCEIQQLTMNGDSTKFHNYSNINQLYYFASPKILSGQSKKIMKLYRMIYLDSFRKICTQLVEQKIECSIFYPSTIFINTTPVGLESYIKIKSEGEKLCEKLNKNNILNIISARLPRMNTDQNQTMIISNFVDNSQILLPYIEQMQN